MSWCMCRSLSSVVKILEVSPAPSVFKKTKSAKWSDMEGVIVKVIGRICSRLFF